MQFVNIPPVGKQFTFLITWDAGRMLQIWRRKSLFEPWKYFEVPKVPAFSSPAKEEEKGFSFLQISIFPPEGRDQNRENPTKELFPSVPPEEPETTLEAQLPRPVQPRGRGTPWPPTRQAETGADPPLSPSHLQAMKDFISIGLQENSGSAPLLRVGSGT